MRREWKAKKNTDLIVNLWGFGVLGSNKVTVWCTLVQLRIVGAAGGAPGLAVRRAVATVLHAVLARARLNSPCAGLLFGAARLVWVWLCWRRCRCWLGLTDSEHRDRALCCVGLINIHYFLFRPLF